ncbi:MAG TPA: hypothetical protein VF426_06810 [Marmoricola sp.]
MSGRLVTRVSAALMLVAAPVIALVVPIGAADAVARVSISNGSTGAQIDRTHMTILRLEGHGFQSVRGGFGGIYVLFGEAGGTWRPSAHGRGTLLYVPDSQSKSNAGYQKFVAFPGDSTAGSANGGTIAADGTWSTTIRVPGSTFKAPGADGKVHTVDCTKVTCGVITIGAHGVANRRNETFTPVSVTDLQAGPDATSTSAGDTEAPSSTATDTTSSTSPATGRPRLRVDRASAVAGKVMAFTATGLPPGRQVSAVFDDGAAGVGPLTVAADGRLAALITLPLDTGSGTHELRLVGAGSVAPVLFAVSPATVAGRDAGQSTAGPTGRGWKPIGFATASGCVFVAALAFALRRRWGRHVVA